MFKAINIGSGFEYPSNELSNFYPYKFIFKGVVCQSMEGLLQSFKFDDPEVQKEICKLTGIQAKREGAKRNKNWITRQVLWWEDKEYPRKSKDYQELLDDAFESLSLNNKFREALLSTKNYILMHSMGSRLETKTVLTENEFCNRLEAIRDRLQNAL